MAYDNIPVLLSINQNADISNKFLKCFTCFGEILKLKSNAFSFPISYHGSMNDDRSHRSDHQSNYSSGGQSSSYNDSDGNSREYYGTYNTKVDYNTSNNTLAASAGVGIKNSDNSLSLVVEGKVSTDSYGKCNGSIHAEFSGEF